MDLEMDSNLVECEQAGRDVCVCKGGPTLAILKDVQKVYEERMAMIERVGGDQKLQVSCSSVPFWGVWPMAETQTGMTPVISVDGPQHKSDRFIKDGKGEN